MSDPVLLTNSYSVLLLSFFHLLFLPFFVFPTSSLACAFSLPLRPQMTTAICYFSQFIEEIRDQHLFEIEHFSIQIREEVAKLDTAGRGGLVSLDTL